MVSSARRVGLTAEKANREELGFLLFSTCVSRQGNFLLFSPRRRRSFATTNNASMEESGIKIRTRHELLSKYLTYVRSNLLDLA